MLKNLVAKDFALSLHPAMSIWLLMGALLLIPTWPYYIAFAYVFLNVMLLYQMDRVNQDLLFTAMLPGRKRDIPAARTTTVCIMELAFVAVSIPFAIGWNFLYTAENPISMNLNVAFYGTVFLMYALFNAIFLPWFYRSLYSFLAPLLVGSLVPVFVVAGLNTLVIVVPALDGLFNDRGLGHLGYQVLALGVGVLAWLGASLWASARSGANIEKADL
ncbi:MAG: ABC-2 transporter permease [Propionibacteriaceae bacterium]|jgi:hypothetical protein|nr:ABC-2 transporter permease [Propionibacteriaceae bacterium]